MYLFASLTRTFHEEKIEEKKKISFEMSWHLTGSLLTNMNGRGFSECFVMLGVHIKILIL